VEQLQLYEETDLKECPFCGGVPEIKPTFAGWLKVSCTVCSADINGFTTDPQEVADMWNHRLDYDASFVQGVILGGTSVAACIVVLYLINAVGF
jgi:hypothetical protein